MEGLKSEIEAKQRELANLEQQMQLEHEHNALDVVRRAFPTDSRFNKLLHSIDIDGRLFFFKIRFRDNVQIFSHPNNCIESLYVRDNGSEFACEPTFVCIEKNWRESHKSECKFLGVKESDCLACIIAKVARFWADVETALTIYISQMTNCSDGSIRMPHFETFANEFAKLKHVE